MASAAIDADRRRLKAARQARWRANRRMRVHLGLPPSPQQLRVDFDRRFPIPFGWSIRVARAWAQSDDSPPATQSEADAWRAAHGL
jgi:hypothetical protein